MKVLFRANKRLNIAYLLQDSFDQLWSYETAGWARRFFDQWCDSLKWQRLKPFEKFAAMIDAHWDGIVSYCHVDNIVSLGFVEGLINKIRAYALQDRGLDTVEANLALGFRDDERDYSIAAHMLTSLNIGSIRLMTNNPDKIKQLEQHGIRISGRIPHVMPPNEYNRFYLETKAARSGHMIDFHGKRRLEEQNEPTIVEGMVLG